MWVYQESSEKARSASEKAESSQNTPQSLETVSAIANPSMDRPPHPPAKVPAESGRRNLSRDCVALAAAYLFGALLSGIVLALCRTNELDMLSAYLDNWSGLFTLDESGAVWNLFGAEYLTAAGGATVLLLLGLSAFGPVLIYLFAMLFGLGIGVLELQLFLRSGWQSALLGLLLTGVPTAAAVTCLCLFGASALRVSGRLQHAAFGKKNLSAGPEARRLLGQYLVLNVLFLPICGVSTALVCLVHQMSAGLIS